MAGAPEIARAVVRRSLSAGVFTLLFSLLQAPTAQAELGTPQLGQVHKWICNAKGDLPTSYVTKVLAIEDGLLIMEEQVDRKIGRLEVPLGLQGLHLYSLRVLPEGRGERRQSFDPAVFAGYTALEPGAEMTTDVEETDGTETWTWRYTVKVGEPELVKQELLGEVEVIPVTEERWIYRETEGTSYQFTVVPDRSLVLNWRYQTPEGEHFCDLYLSYRKKVRESAE